MKFRAMSFLVVVLVSASAFAQGVLPKGASIPPVSDSCPVPVAPEIVMTAMSLDGNPLNVWAVLYRSTTEGNVYVAQSSCSVDGTGEGCFNNGRAKFTVDNAGNKLVAGDYMVMAYGPAGFTGAIAEFHVETGATPVNLLLKQQTVSISIFKSSSRHGTVTYEFGIVGDVPAGTDLYTIVSAYGPTTEWVQWEANRKALNGGGDYSGQVLKQSFFAEGAPTGFQICGTVYLAQRGAPTRPVAMAQFCAINEK